MSDKKKKYDMTIARIAGNVASGIAGIFVQPAVTGVAVDVKGLVSASVNIARKIVEEVERTEFFDGEAVTNKVDLS